MKVQKAAGVQDPLSAAWVFMSMCLAVGQERTKLQEQLAELPSARASAQQEQALTAEIAGLERDVAYKESESKEETETQSLDILSRPPSCESTRSTQAELQPTPKDDNKSQVPSPSLLPENIAPEVTSESAPITTAATTTAEDASNLSRKMESVVVMERSLTLPQLVDNKDIACTYSNGLLRVEIPIKPPTFDDEQAEVQCALVEKLQQEAADANVQVASLEKQMREQKAKTAAALSALREAQSEMQRTIKKRRFSLALSVK